MKEDKETARKLICESCGTAFFCGSNVGRCWCFDVEIGSEDLDKLRNSFENCLCNNCLNELQTNQKIL